MTPSAESDDNHASELVQEGKHMEVINGIDEFMCYSKI